MNLQPAELTAGTPEDGSVVHASQSGVDTSKKHNERDISRLQGTAHEYEEKSYKEGDLVTNSLEGEDDIVYLCITDITVPEAFNEAKWHLVQNAVAIQGVFVNVTAPENGQVVAYNSTEEEYIPIDVNAVEIQGVPVITTAPENGQVITYDSGEEKYVPTNTITEYPLEFPDDSTMSTASSPNPLLGQITNLKLNQSFIPPLPVGALFATGMWVVKRIKKVFLLLNLDTTESIYGYDYDGVDLSTMALDGTSLLVSDDVAVSGEFAMDYEGDNIYIADGSSNAIIQFKGSSHALGTFTHTGGDELPMTTASGTVPDSIHLHPDGKTVYILLVSNNTVTTWDMSTAKEINTGSLVAETSSLTDTNSGGIWINEIGSSLLYLGWAERKIYQRPMNNNWDTLTANVTYETTFPNPAVFPVGLVIDETTNHLSFISTTTIYDYIFSDVKYPLDFPDNSLMSTAASPNPQVNNIVALTSKELDVNPPKPAGTVILRGTWFVRSKKKALILMTVDGDAFIYGYDWDGITLSSLALDGTVLDMSADVTTPEDFCMDNEGDNIYVVDSGDDDIKQYRGSNYNPDNFSFTAGDLLDVSTGAENPRAIHMHPYNKIVYIAGDLDNTISTWPLDEAKEINTGSTFTGTPLAVSDSSIAGLWLPRAGDKLYYIGLSGQDVYQTPMTTNYDVNGANTDEEIIIPFPNGGILFTEMFFEEETGSMYFNGLQNLHKLQFRSSAAAILDVPIIPNDDIKNKSTLVYIKSTEEWEIGGADAKEIQGTEVNEDIEPTEGQGLVLDENNIYTPTDVRPRLSAKRQITLSPASSTLTHKVGLGAGAFSTSSGQSAILSGSGLSVLHFNSGALGTDSGYKQIASVRRSNNFNVSFKFQIPTGVTLSETNIYLGFFETDPAHNSDLDTNEHVALIRRLSDVNGNSFSVSFSAGTSEGHFTQIAADTAIHTVTFIADNAGATFTVLFDGVDVGSLGSNVPAAGTDLNLYVWVEQGASNNNLVGMEYWYVDGFANA